METKIKAQYETPATEVVEVRMDSCILQASLKGYGEEIPLGAPSMFYSY